MRSVAARTAGLLCCVGLVGCGGGGGDKALSRSDLLSRAGAICTTANRQTAKLTQPTNLGDAGQAATYFAALEPVIAKELADLRKLKPGEGEKAAFDAFVMQLDRARVSLVTLRDKAKAKDPNAGKALVALGTAGQALAGRAKALGAAGCATAS